MLATALSALSAFFKVALLTRLLKAGSEVALTKRWLGLTLCELGIHG